eukprot:TRINITY_DN7091_c0_g1_i3.p1 TRINITY_DN7091_c0_g1~~TRINITY_DN7091_c0_g1_i3.p1  ORF type:complete len:641 (-),score=112.90 TRINITY_DN7091_c0_g1_i3:978-2900(-)
MGWKVSSSKTQRFQFSQTLVHFLINNPLAIISDLLKNSNRYMWCNSSSKDPLSPQKCQYCRKVIYPQFSKTPKNFGQWFFSCCKQFTWVQLKPILMNYSPPTNFESSYVDFDEGQGSSTPFRLVNIAKLTISLDPDGKPKVDFSYQLEMTSRFTRLNEGTYLSHLVLVQFETDHFYFIRWVLSCGIIFPNTCSYQFLFYTDSMSELRKAWFLRYNSKISPEQLTRHLGDFHELWKNPSKLSCRLSHTCSKTLETVTVNRDEIVMTEDVIRTNYCFTDGVGIINAHLAAEISQKLGKLDSLPNDSDLDTPEKELCFLRKIPSAFQIRIAGCKGVVVAWPRSVATARLMIRPSQVKFKSNCLMLEVCKCSGPRLGYLNQQFIQNLEATDTNKDHIFALARLEVERLQNILEDPTTHAPHSFLQRILNSYKSFSKEELLQESTFMDNTRKMVLNIMTKFQQRPKIPVDQSRLVLGVVDETDSLNEGEVFFQYSPVHVTKDCSNKASLLVGRVWILRNPTYLVEDFFFAHAVMCPKLLHLVDVLVFSRKGSRPAADRIAGGDLDGDMFMICWDPQLIPSQDCINKIGEENYGHYVAPGAMEIKDLFPSSDDKLGLPKEPQNYLIANFPGPSSQIGVVSTIHTLV